MTLRCRYFNTVPPCRHCFRCWHDRYLPVRRPGRGAAARSLGGRVMTHANALTVCVKNKQTLFIRECDRRRHAVTRTHARTRTLEGNGPVSLNTATPPSCPARTPTMLQRSSPTRLPVQARKGATTVHWLPVPAHSTRIRLCYLFVGLWRMKRSFASSFNHLNSSIFSSS